MVIFNPFLGFSYNDNVRKIVANKGPGKCKDVNGSSRVLQAHWALLIFGGLLTFEVLEGCK